LKLEGRTDVIEGEERGPSLEQAAHRAQASTDQNDPADRSDEDLLQGIAEGCERSFRTFFGRWAPPLGRFLRRATGSAETAEDLLQEAFLRVFAAAPRFEPRGSVRAWVYRICANLAYSYWRRERASPIRLEGGNGPDLERRAPDSQSPEQEHLRRSFRHDAVAALARCPENHRIVFLLKIDQGMTYEQIAEILRCPVGTAKSRFHFAVRRLREELRDWDDAIPADGRNGQ
jgi:RNA polymerase sigma-70 factor (ECF subfamily)